MSERKQQTRFVPLRLRFRAPAEQAKREHADSEENQELYLADAQNSRGNNSMAWERASASLKTSSITPLQRRNQQVTALLHLSQRLRPTQELQVTLQQIIEAVHACTGFRSAIINLIEGKTAYLVPIAFAGCTEEEQQFICDNPVSIGQLQRMMRPEFRIHLSYFIPHHYVITDLSDVGIIVSTLTNHEEAAMWHPQDLLIVPLVGSHDDTLLGFLSLDEPDHGKIPNAEQIEIGELFANEIAQTIEQIHVLQAQEAEKHSLELAITCLHEDLERVRQGELHGEVRLMDKRLRPITQSLNTMFMENSTILAQMGKVTAAVDEHARSVQHASELLVRDTSQQERQMHQISQVLTEMAINMHHVSERAADLSKIAVEAMDVAMDGQGAVDRAVEGMSKVREATLHSSRTMKRLGESGQEINKTVITITDLTTRMHLLALNAAIEAARAGEHGQGLALVAQEMRALASHSADAARKVSTYIRSIQHETTAVAQSVEKNTQQVVTQTELVIQSGTALEAISVVTDQMANLVQGICNTAENQTQGSQLVVGTIHEMLHMTGEITQHMREMQESLNHLTTLTDSLRTRMTSFKLN